MGFVVFLIALVLEYSPVEKWNWDFGFCWVVIAFLLVVEIAVKVTNAQRPPQGGSK